MAIVAPKGRKHLSADALFRLVHTGFDHIPDYRPADADISLTDALMAAFAMFSLKSPSLLAFDKERAVIPLMPEPIVKQDGTSKNDCERNAAKRFVAKLRHDHPHLKFSVTEDSLSSNAPHIETLQAHGLHYILGVKEGDHASLFQHVQVAEHTGRVTYYERHDRAAGVVHRFRFVNDLPLNAAHTDVRV